MLSLWWKIGRNSCLTGLKWEGQSRGEMLVDQVEWYHSTEMGGWCRHWCLSSKTLGGTAWMHISCSEYPSHEIGSDSLLLLKERSPCKFTNLYIKRALSSFSSWIASLLPLMFISVEKQILKILKQLFSPLIHLGSIKDQQGSSGDFLRQGHVRVSHSYSQVTLTSLCRSGCSNMTITTRLLKGCLPIRQVQRLRVTAFIFNLISRRILHCLFGSGLFKCRVIHAVYALNKNHLIRVKIS